MPDQPYWYFQQSGVLPFRVNQSSVEVLLITSRSGKKWLIPKGIIEFGMSPEDSARKEAFEEAGIDGTVFTDSIGHYSFRKWGGICNVEVFPMLVEVMFDDWEEKFRKRKWYSIKEAVQATSQPELIHMLLEFQTTLRDRGIIE